MRGPPIEPLSRMIQRLRIERRRRRHRQVEYWIYTSWHGARRVNHHIAYELLSADRIIHILWADLIAYAIRHDPEVTKLSTEQLVAFACSSPESIEDYEDGREDDTGTLPGGEFRIH